MTRTKTKPRKRAATAAAAAEPKDRVATPFQDKLLRVLGPGLITGASDDDPSGIATYSQAGAQFGFGIAWTLLFTYPLMAAIQEISARIGRVTGTGHRRQYAASLPELDPAVHRRAAAGRQHDQHRGRPRRHGRRG